MSRPRTQTVEYFPHSTNASDGKTIFILERKFGIVGYAFWFKLLELLGRAEGHTLKLVSVPEIEFFGAKTGVSGTEIPLILDLLSSLDAIDADLWKNHKILWCQNLVDGLAPVYQKRKTTPPKRPAPVVSGEKTPVLGTDIPLPNQNAGRNPTKEGERVKEGEEVERVTPPRSPDPVSKPESIGKDGASVLPYTSLTDEWTTRAISEGMTKVTAQHEFRKFCSYRKGFISKDWPEIWDRWCLTWTSLGKRQVPEEQESGEKSNALATQAELCLQEHYGECRQPEGRPECQVCKRAAV